MARRVFYSFHYKPDNWRVASIRNIGVIEGNRSATDNNWESIKSSGEQAIKRWIDDQMKGKSCVVVLIGSATAGRKWIKYEIEKGWNDGKGLLGIHIHNLKDRHGNQSSKGRNPFEDFNINGIDLTRIVKTYDPTGMTSQAVYNTISRNIAGWFDEAAEIRKKY